MCPVFFWAGVSKLCTYVLSIIKLNKKIYLLTHTLVIEKLVAMSAESLQMVQIQTRLSTMLSDSGLVMSPISGLLSWGALDSCGIWQWLPGLEWHIIWVCEWGGGCCGCQLWLQFFKCAHITLPCPSFLRHKIFSLLKLLCSGNL